MHSLIFIDQGEILGGAERYIIDLLNAMTPAEIAQFQPLVLGAEAEAYRAKLPSGVASESANLPSFKGNAVKKLLAGARLLPAGMALGKRVKAASPNLVVTNTPRAHFAVLVGWWLGAWRGNWAVVVHDFHTEKKVWSSVEKWLRRAIFKQAKTIIAVSVITRQKVRGYLKEGEFGKVRIIENGLDIVALPAARISTEITKVLQLGRIDPRKGQRIFAAGVAKVPKIYGFIAGSENPGDPATVTYKAALEADAKPIKNLHLLGEVTAPWAMLAEADAIVVLPTEPETFGRVVIEALCMGTLPLVANMTGPKEIVQQYAKWLGVPPDVFLISDLTPEAVAEKLQAAAELSADELAFLVDRGRDFVAEQYSLHESKKRLLELV